MRGYIKNLQQYRVLYQYQFIRREHDASYYLLPFMKLHLNIKIKAVHAGLRIRLSFVLELRLVIASIKCLKICSRSFIRAEVWYRWMTFRLLCFNLSLAGLRYLSSNIKPPSFYLRTRRPSLPTTRTFLPNIRRVEFLLHTIPLSWGFLFHVRCALLS